MECVETEPKGRCCVLMLGKCARVRSPSQKQSALVSRHRRSDGLDGRGMRRGVTTRVYIFHFRKRLIKYTNGGGSPPGCVSCGVQLRRGRKHAAIGPMSLCIFTAVCQCGSHCCYHPVSPVCSAATGRETPALGTHDRLSFARSRPPLALSSRAHGTRSDESSAGPAITSDKSALLPCWPAGQLVTQPPILDSSRPDAPLLLANLLSPSVTPKKHSRIYVIASKGAVPPAPRRASAK